MTVATERVSPAGANYARDGYVVFRSLFDPDAMHAAAQDADRLHEYRHLISVRNLRCRWQDNVSPASASSRRSTRSSTSRPPAGELATDPRLLAALGEPLRRAGLPVQGQADLQAARREGVRAAPGLDRLGPLPAELPDGAGPARPGRPRQRLHRRLPRLPPQRPLTPADGEYHELPPETVDETKAVPLELEPGDVAVFGGFTPHRSDPNSTGPLAAAALPQLHAPVRRRRPANGHYHEFHAWLMKKYAEYGKTGLYFE